MKTTFVRLVIVLAIVSIAVSASSAQDGWKIVDESGEVSLISNGRLKQSWDNDAFIMDGKKNRLLFLSAEKKTYAEGTPEEYCTLMKEAQDAMMAQLPADQRAMVEGMLGKKPGEKPRSVVIEPQGPGGKVSGLDTQKYHVVVNGELYEEVWLATDPDIQKHFKPLVGVFRVFSECVSPLGMQNAVETSKEYLDLYEKGIEVKARRAGGEGEGKSLQESRVERVTVPASEFAVPAGYTRIDLRTFVKGQMGGMKDEE